MFHQTVAEFLIDSWQNRAYVYVKNFKFTVHLHFGEQWTNGNCFYLLVKMYFL